MVFQKKGASAVKNTQANKKKGKKAFEADDADDLDMFDDMDDSDDFEEDSDEDMPVQKTPKNKTPKGRQSMSEKKVSFEIPDKTPGKTPQKNSSLITKKTPTPAAKGKTFLQEFKGMKGKAQQKGAAEDDSEDEDDDDDDDDDEEEDLDLQIDEDMDEEDDSDEEDDDSDEDEEDEGQKQNLKQKNNADQLKQKSPVKATSNLKGNQTPIGQTPKSEIKKEKNTPKKEFKEEKTNLKNSGIKIADEVQRRRERDARSLYIGNLPNDVQAEELKELSKDINEVIIPRLNRYSNPKKRFAFLTFDSEAKAEANFKILKSKKFRDQLLQVDFVGQKSQKRSNPVEEKTFNMRKLYVTGVPVDATLAQVAEFFPKAFQITFNKSPTFRSATINFWTVEESDEAFTANKEIELMGHKLVVVHSTATDMTKRSKRKRGKKDKKNNQNNQESSPKKMKIVKQEEESEESSDEE